MELVENDWLIDWIAKVTLPTCLITWIHLGTLSHQLHRGMGIPWLCLIPPSPQLHFGPSTNQLFPGILLPLLHPGPSSHWLHTGQSLPGCLLHSPSLRLHRGTHSHLRFLGPPAPPLPLVIRTSSRSLCPSMSPGLSVHSISPGTHHLPSSPHSVRLKFQPWLLPPSVPPWVTLVLAASRCAQPWISPPSTSPWTLPLVLRFASLLCHKLPVLVSISFVSIYNLFSLVRDSHS